MNVGEAAETLALMLEVDTVRYPEAVRNAHINQAMVNLSREYDTWPDEAITELELGTTARDYLELVELQIAPYTRLKVEHIDGAWTNLTANTLTELKEMTFQGMMGKYGDQVGPPKAFSIVGEFIYFRPMLAEGADEVPVRFLWKGVPRNFSASETPKWLDMAPFGVIYRAGEIASVWLLEDERALSFKALRDQEMENLDLAAGMRGDGSSTEMEAP